MGEIRSAIEIAMERTAGIRSDKNAVETGKRKNEGKKAAALFLDGGDAEAFSAAIRGAADKNAFTAGALPVFCAAVRLPEQDADVENIRRLAEGIALLLPQAGLEALFRQGEVVFRQYLEDREAARRAVEQQFEPRRKAREEELSRRYNQRISLSLAQDPEYVSTLSKHLNALRAQYEAVVAEIRGRIQEAGGLQEEEDGGQAEG